LIEGSQADSGFFLSALGFELGPTPWATPPVIFWDGFFQDRVSQTISPGWRWMETLLIPASWVARIIGMSHWWPVDSECLDSARKGVKPGIFIR
jgi:hypothetical protein